jgi:sugar-specific transcriptional regulator TrmB
LDLGPSTGYAVAKAARVARANAYAALEGLARRGAARGTTGSPVLYRATDPETLLVRLAAEDAERLERLSRSLQGVRRTAEPASRSLEGTRAVTTVIHHLVARAEQRIEGVLAADLWPATLPAWRRAASRAELRVRVTGDTLDTDGLVANGAPPDHPTLLLIDDVHVLVATRAGDAHSGLWSTSPHVMLLGRSALGERS